MPEFDPATPVARHPTHCLHGGWVAPSTVPVLSCSYCGLVVGDPKILEPCPGDPCTLLLGSDPGGVDED